MTVINTMIWQKFLHRARLCWFNKESIKKLKTLAYRVLRAKLGITTHFSNQRLLWLGLNDLWLEANLAIISTAKDLIINRRPNTGFFETYYSLLSALNISENSVSKLERFGPLGWNINCNPQSHPCFARKYELFVNCNKAMQVIGNMTNNKMKIVYKSSQKFQSIGNMLDLEELDLIREIINKIRRIGFVNAGTGISLFVKKKKRKPFAGNNLQLVANSHFMFRSWHNLSSECLNLLKTVDKSACIQVMVYKRIRDELCFINPGCDYNLGLEFDIDMNKYGRFMKVISLKIDGKNDSRSLLCDQHSF